MPRCPLRVHDVCQAAWTLTSLGPLSGGCVRIVAAGGDVVVEVRGAPRRGGTAASTAAAHERGVPRSAGGRGGGVPAARGGQGTHPRRAGAAQGPVGRHGLRACRPWDARLTRRRRTRGVRGGMQRDELRIQGVIRRLTSSTSASTTPALATHMATVRGGRSLARASPPPQLTPRRPLVCAGVFSSRRRRGSRGPRRGGHAWRGRADGRPC